LTDFSKAEKKFLYYTYINIQQNIPYILRSGQSEKYPFFYGTSPEKRENITFCLSCLYILRKIKEISPLTAENFYAHRNFTQCAQKFHAMRIEISRCAHRNFPLSAWKKIAHRTEKKICPKQNHYQENFLLPTKRIFLLFATKTIYNINYI
jgi:hypothetical protein